jgi:hypothetical protein
MKNNVVISIVLNDNRFDYTNEINAIRQGFLILTKKMPYQSTEIIKDNIDKMCNLFIEALLNSKKTFEDKLRNRLYGILFKKLIHFNKTISKFSYLDGNKAVELIYNFSLSLDGIGFLNGFGFSNKMKSKLLGNSEKESVVPKKFRESKTQKINDKKEEEVS